MSKQTDELVRKLYMARLEKKIAREAMVAAAEAHGMCTVFPFPSLKTCISEFRYPDDEGAPTTWCEACAARQPSWKVWREKSKAAGGALRSVLSAGKRLAKR